MPSNRSKVGQGRYLIQQATAHGYFLLLFLKDYCSQPLDGIAEMCSHIHLPQGLCRVSSLFTSLRGCSPPSLLSLCCICLSSSPASRGPASEGRLKATSHLLTQRLAHMCLYFFLFCLPSLLFWLPRQSLIFVVLLNHILSAVLAYKPA